MMAKENIYEVIIIGRGVNHHFELKSNKLPIRFRYGGDTVYKIESSDLFLAPRGLKDKITRAPRKHLVVFKEGESSAVGLEQDSKITSELLFIAESSQTLKHALAGLFKEPFSLGIGGKKVVFIFLGIVVVSVIILVATGQLDLKGMLGGM